MNIVISWLVLSFIITPTMPLFITTASSQLCLAAGGRIEPGAIKVDDLPAPLDYRVYLPPCYDQEQDQAYPVLYLFHGQSYNDDQWDRMGIDEAANRLIATGAIAPLIIVMPRDRRWDQPNVDLFGQVVVNDLIPKIDRDYRTLPDREHRAVGGLSRGGGWAVHLGLSRWELFGAIGGHSLAVFWSDVSKIRGWLSEIPAGQKPRIYLDIGDRDRPAIYASAANFEKILTQMGLPHEWHQFTGYHEESYWQKHLDQYLRWYTQEWQKAGVGSP